MINKLLVGLIIFILCLSIVSVQDVEAAIVPYLVDTTIDSNATAYQACTGAAGDCSLRGAITKANNGIVTDTFQITIPANTYILTGSRNENSNTTGDLDLTADIRLVGAGSGTTIIDAGDFDRVLEHLGSKPLTISGLTLRNGNILDDGGGGGGLRIASSGSTTLTDVIVEDNLVNGDEFVNDNGGGIALISGTLVVQNSLIQDNQSYSAGGIYTSGGNLTITDSTINGNMTNSSNGLGGGIRQETVSHVSLERCIISNNVAYNGGGFSSGPAGQVYMTDTLFINNEGYYGGGVSIYNLASMLRVSFAGNDAFWGGGIYLGDPESSLEFINGTIAGNKASRGGGVALIDISQASFIHATLAGNTLNEYGIGYELFFDYVNYDGSSFTISNSILSSNYTDNACFINVDLIGFTSQGYNIGSDNTCRLTQPSDHPSTDALLTGIRLYRYHAYLTPGVGSPAIDAADPSLVDYPTDQRGRMRVDGDLNGTIVADIGAIEYYPFSVFIAFLQK